MAFSHHDSHVATPLLIAIGLLAPSLSPAALHAADGVANDAVKTPAPPISPASALVSSPAVNPAPLPIADLRPPLIRRNAPSGIKNVPANISDVPPNTLNIPFDGEVAPSNAANVAPVHLRPPALTATVLSAALIKPLRVTKASVQEVAATATGEAPVGDTTPTRPAPTTTPSVEAKTQPKKAPKGQGSAVPGAQPDISELFADNFHWEGNVLVLEGNERRPARFISGVGEITARTVRVDVENRTLKAAGKVKLQRTRQDNLKVMRSSNVPTRYERGIVTESLEGENLEFDFIARKGKLDRAHVELAFLDLDVASLTINGEKYIARNVVLRPGGQTPEEDKIYGIPPLNLRARKIELTVPRNGVSPQMTASGAGLYFKNTRLFPLPRILFGYARRINAPREQKSFNLAPGLSFNSADRVLVTTEFRVPLSSANTGLSFVTDLGLSANLGFRGGTGLEMDNGLGRLTLRGQVKDVVTTQLTNRILLNRLPELAYTSRDVPLFRLPGGRLTGLRIEGSLGDYKERLISAPSNLAVNSTRRFGSVHFTTRKRDRDGFVPAGVYVDLFATRARYSLGNARYDTNGFELGYDGNVTRKLRGVLSYRQTNLSGATPFLFDTVEIPREVRATFDYLWTPRYTIPLDLRYDIDRKDLRDATFGLLRSYKNFAYGLTYNTARSNLSLEFRTGF